MNLKIIKWIAYIKKDYKSYLYAPLRLENSGGGNCDVNDAKCGGKNRGVVCCPLWSKGRKLLKKKFNFK